MAAYITAYITASISAKLQCNFLTPYFSPYPITHTQHPMAISDEIQSWGEEGMRGGVFMEQPTFLPSLFSSPSPSIHPAH